MNTEAEIKVQKLLEKFTDEKYRIFNTRIVATVPLENMIGVKTPEQRQVAKIVFNSDYKEDFLQSLPHKTFEENQVHSFIIEKEKDRNIVISLLENFLPFIDNWATCDCCSPNVFKKKPPEIQLVRKWLSSTYVYVQRFAIGMFRRYYLDELFKKEYLDDIAQIKSDEYYVNMMRAWFFATSLTKQYQSTILYLEKKKLDKWTHNKTIQKAIESFCVSREHKTYLVGLRLK